MVYNLQNVGVVGEDVYDRETWRKIWCLLQRPRMEVRTEKGRRKKIIIIIYIDHVEGLQACTWRPGRDNLQHEGRGTYLFAD